MALNGEVTNVPGSVLVLDAGTGEATVALVDGGVTGQVEAGDCLIAERPAVVPATDGPDDALVGGGDFDTDELVLEDQ